MRTRPTLHLIRHPGRSPVTETMLTHCCRTPGTDGYMDHPPLDAVSPDAAKTQATTMAGLAEQVDRTNRHGGDHRGYQHPDWQHFSTGGPGERAQPQCREADNGRNGGNGYRAPFTLHRKAKSCHDG